MLPRISSIADYRPGPGAKKLAVQNVRSDRPILQRSTNRALMKKTVKMANFGYSFLNEGRTILTASDTPYLLRGIPFFRCIVLMRLGHPFLFIYT